MQQRLQKPHIAILRLIRFNRLGLTSEAKSSQNLRMTVANTLLVVALSGVVVGVQVLEDGHVGDLLLGADLGGYHVTRTKFDACYDAIGNYLLYLQSGEFGVPIDFDFFYHLDVLFCG